MGVIVQQKYRNYRLVMCTFLLAQRTYVSSISISRDFKIDNNINGGKNVVKKFK